MSSPWRSTGSKAKARLEIRVKENQIRVDRKENPNKREKKKENQRIAMTKAVILEKGSQHRIQGKEKEKVNESAMCAANLAIWPRTVGAV